MVHMNISGFPYFKTEHFDILKRFQTMLCSFCPVLALFLFARHDLFVHVLVLDAYINGIN